MGLLYGNIRNAKHGFNAILGVFSALDVSEV